MPTADYIGDKPPRETPLFFLHFFSTRDFPCSSAARDLYSSFSTRDLLYSSAARDLGLLRVTSTFPPTRVTCTFPSPRVTCFIPLPGGQTALLETDTSLSVTKFRLK